VTTVDEPDPDPDEPGAGWVVLGANTQFDTAFWTF
jgi:hypothetical protein